MPGADGYRELLRNRRFLLYEGSTIAATVGYAVYSISIPWLTLQFSGSLLLVGLVLFAEFGVYTLTFLVAPWVDRAKNKRTIFLLCYPVQAVMAAAIGLALGQGHLSTYLLLSLVIGISFLWDFAWAASNIVPRLLLSRDQLFLAQGFGGLLGGVVQILGYAVGGVLIAVIGPEGGMYLYAALLAAGSLLVAGVSLPATPTGALGAYWAEFRDGWRHFVRTAERSLLHLGTVELVRGFFNAAPALFITLIAARVFLGSPSTYAVLFAAWVIGGVVIGLVLGQLNPRRRIGRVLPVAVVAEALCVVVAGVVAPVLAASILLWALVGASGTAYLTAEIAYLQGAYSPETLGRITSNLYLFTGTGGSVGALALGLLANSLTAPEFGAIVAAGLFFAGVLLVALPGTRNLAF